MVDASVFFDSNRQAAERGVLIKRVFLIDKQDINAITTTADVNIRDSGMHLTPETPTYSMRGCGGLPADAGGV